jgi:hypothetical protein
MAQRPTADPQVSPAARDAFYRLLEQVPESEDAWAKRQATLRGWGADPCFEPYWRVIQQMLTVDFTTFCRRIAAATGQLEGYDYDAWRQQRDYDVQHARDHLP